MALVAVLGWGVGVATLTSRSVHNKNQAVRHERIAARLRAELRALEAGDGTSEIIASRRQALASEEWQAQRFRAGQGRPWLALPDGPE